MTCRWTWTGSAPWVKVADDCGQGTACAVPHGDGTYIGEQRDTDCEGPE